MSTSPDTMLLDLQKQLSEMLDPLDIPRSWTDRQLNDYEAKRALLISRIRTIQQEAPLLSELEEQIAETTKWHQHLVSWRETLSQELQDLGVPRTPEQLGQQQNLRLSLSAVLDHGSLSLDLSGYSLETLRLGALMRQDGYAEATPRNGESVGRLPWNGSVSETEDRLKTFTWRRDAAKLRLDEALESDAEREQRAKDGLARVAALNAKPERKTRGDGSQYDKYPDGRIVEVQSGVGGGGALPGLTAFGHGRVTPPTEAH